MTDETLHRQKIRVRVRKASRTWRWKVAAAVVLAMVTLLSCSLIVPRILSALISDNGGGSSPSEPAPQP